jgi:hypothetical protein
MFVVEKGHPQGRQTTGPGQARTEDVEKKKW